MKAEEILKNKGVNDFTKNHAYSYLYKSVIEAMEEYASLKVSESTLPNVKDWDEVESVFTKGVTPYQAMYVTYREVFEFLKQHYSAPVSASEQKPDGYVIDGSVFLFPESANTDIRINKVPVYFSPQPNKVSLSDEIKTMKCNNCGTKMVYTQNTNCCDECWLKIG